MGGFISDKWRLPLNGLEGGQGQYTLSQGASLFRREFLGHLAPAEMSNVGAISDSGSVFNSLPRAIAVDASSASPFKYYFMCGGLGGTAPRLVKADLVTGTYAVATHGSRDISATSGNNFTTLPSTGFWGEDVLFYTALYTGSPIPMILYSWNDSGNGAVGMATLSGSSPTFISDNFFSTSYFSGIANPTPGVPHRMCVGQALNVVYMTNGQYLASWDGSTPSSQNGTYQPQALNCGAGWVAVDVVNYQNYVAVACQQTGTTANSILEKTKTKVLLWDGSALDANFIYDAEDYSISGLFNGDQLYAFTEGRNGTTKLKNLPIAYGVSKLSTVYETSNAIIGHAPDPRSIDWYEGNIVWHGNTISSGQPYLTAFMLGQGGGLHQPYVETDSSGALLTKVGVVSNVSAGKLMIGGYNGSAYGVSWLDGTGGYYIGISSVQWLSALTALPYRSTITRIKIYFSQFTTNSSLKFSLYKDYNSLGYGGSTDLVGYTINNTTEPNAAVNLAVTLPKKALTDISNFCIGLIWNQATAATISAVVRKIEITYEIVDKP